MAVPIRLAARLVLAWCWLSTVLSFNLEPRIPIVKEGSPHSHFGYTVAQHQSIIGTPTGGERRKSWILVGAPKDHNLQPGTNRSGALWKCPLTTLTTDCVQVHTDGFRNPETRLYNFDYLDDNSLSRPVEDEIKDGQWLGVTLKSQGPGGKVLVCAHRYMHKGSKFQWGYGLCYILTNNLDVMDNLEPCRGKPVGSGHEQYGFCQAGTSGLLREDEVVLGVPGPFTWRGTVHTSNISDNFLLKDKTQYFGPVTVKESPVDKYSYLGYSVTAGRFFGNNISYVGGAPRSKETGQVVFFTREKIGNSLLREDLILDGEMFASSFGYEVLALDINGDERDDLVVGAPFYYNRIASGAIYVYMNHDRFKTDHPFTKIEGAPGESRFGSSMTSLGDLNRDGYLDVAVGAPYEGRGAIYIFLGSRKGLVTKPAQVIRAEDLPGTPYNAFGYSLSGGMDLDNNGYPDLLTSSFCSDRVLLLRARPIIDIETKVSNGQLNNIDPSRKGCREDITAEETCFSFDACFKMDNDAGTKTGLQLHYTIEERPYQDRPLARVRFADSAPKQPSEVHRNIVLRPEDMGLFLCSKEIVYLLEGSRDILRPLRFKLTYEIIQKEPTPVAEGDPLPDINEYPILNQKGALRYFEGTFAKECGDDDVCMSDLHVTASLDLEYNKALKHYLLKLGEQDTVPLLVEVTNTQEPAYETSLIITHDKALLFDAHTSKIGAYQCSSNTPGIVKCGVGNPLINTTGPLQINFLESGTGFDSRLITFEVKANSSSTELTPQDTLLFTVEVIKRAEVSIIGSVTPEQVFYGGEVVGESAIKHFDEIGMEVTHTYLVDNRGPRRVDELQVEVLWPYQVENGKEKGKWLLYMTEHPTVDGVGECEIDPSYINPLNFRKSKTYTDAIIGHEVELEGETTDGIRPTPEGPTDTGDGTSVSGTKITKTTTTKKVTSTTTIKKTTSKTSSEKEHSSTSRGSSSSSSTGYSSSSSSASHSGYESYGDNVEGSGYGDGSRSTSRGSSSSSSTGYSSSSSSHSGYESYGDNVEGSGYGDGSRVHGRTHSRVSRRVFTSSDRSRFGANELEGETTEGEDENGRFITQYERTSPDGTSTFKETRHEGDDGRVTTQYERTHHSSGTSPDGTSTFKETRHESRKVTVGKDSGTEHVPSSRWGQGGYRRTHTVSSSSESTISGEPEETRMRWETHRTHSAGQDGDDRWDGSVPSDTHDRREESDRHYSRTHTYESSSRGSHSGGLGEDNSHDRRKESDRHHSRTHTYESSSRGSHSDGLGEDNYRRTHEGGAVTQTIGRDGSYYAGSDRRTRTRVQEGTENRERFVWSGETDRTPYDRVPESRNREGHFYRESSHITDANGSRSRSGGELYPDSDGDRYGSQRVESSSRWSQTRHEDRSSSSQGHDNDGLRRTHDYSSHGGHDDKYSSGGHDRYSSGGHERYSSGGHDDRYSSGQGYRTHHERYDDRNIDEVTRTHSSDHERAGRGQSVDSYRRTSEGERWREREYGRPEHDGSRRDGYARTHGRHDINTDQEGHKKNDGGYGDSLSDSERHRSWSESGTSTWRSHSSSGHEGRGGFDASSGHENRGHEGRGGFDVDSERQYDGDSERHRSQSETRTSSWRSHSISGHENRGNFGVESSRDKAGASSQHFSHVDSGDGTIQNGTYTRVEVDPKTGKTTTYTSKVVYNRWPTDHDLSMMQGDSKFLPVQEQELSSDYERSSRTKREKELIIKPQAVTDEKTGKTMQVVHLQCDGPQTAKCFSFTCNIRHLGARRTASIHIKSRLWNATLVEDYPRVSYVSIKSKGTLILPDDMRDDQSQDDDVDSAETLAYPDLLDQLPPEEVPLWVILVSIFAGLLLLILIVLILWKLGFFERKRPDPTLSGNLDKDANGY